MHGWAWLRVIFSPDHNTVYTSNGEDKKQNFKKRMVHRSRRHRRRVCISLPFFFTKIIHVPSFHLHTTTSTYIYMISCVKFSSIPVPRFYDWYTYGWKYYGARGCMRLVVVHKVDWNAPYFFLMYRRSSNARIISLHARSISIIVAIMVREIPLFSWDTGWRMHTQLIVYIHACPRAYMRTYMYTSIRTYQS